MELNSLRGTLVGLPGVSGFSAEQSKRLTIAVELVANPYIIFMDEPTSGLDARATAIVMRTVRNTLDTGRTVEKQALDKGTYCPSKFQGSLLQHSIFAIYSYPVKVLKRGSKFSAMGSIFTTVLFIGTQNASTMQPVVAV
ncbi:hypothetical protein IFM89_007065 [Coptis chinensis]|uniref:ABC transporter domain-containing protein n=1 Tax=Coptis chinensis TaxID=261450 RepID=A0A835I8Q8_9MAGN|nr:hypothetical protein IFM89_007065 [Coptis chinensis]